MAKAKMWDSTLKQLIHINPAAFVQWLVPGAAFVQERVQELQSEKREMDALLEIVVNEQSMLLHIEFQTRNDASMGERLLLYNILARNAHKLPVFSCVLYLLKDGNVSQSPLSLTIPSGQTIVEFYYQSIEIGKLSSEDILNIGNPTLIPLLPLTKGGETRSEIAGMFERLRKHPRGELSNAQIADLELIAYTLASLVLTNNKNPLDLEWLIGRFREMHDILRETPIYQEILLEGRKEGIEKGIEKGIEEGIEKGIEKGIEQGRLESKRDTVLILVKTGFPALTSLAKEQVSQIVSASLLDDIITKIFLAQTEQEAFLALREWDSTLNVQK